MIEYLKKSKPETEKIEDDKKVRSSVEEILSNIKKNGDKAIRSYSEKFDDYSPKAFKLTDNEIKECISQVSPKDLDDIKIKSVGDEGYDVKNECYGDMFKMGIIDPLKVTKNALINAVSVATTILSTNAIVTHTRVKTT